MVTMTLSTPRPERSLESSRNHTVKVEEETGFYDSTMRTCEDYDLWMRISEKYVIAHVAESLTLVRVTGVNSSVVVNEDVWKRNWSRVMEKLEQRSNA